MCSPCSAQISLFYFFVQIYWLQFDILFQDVGLQLLREGTEVRHGVRDPLCTLIILVYDLYATQMIG